MVGDGVGVIVTDGVGEGVTDTDGVGEGVTVTDGVGEGVGVTDTDGVGEGVVESEGVGVGVGVGVVVMGLVGTTVGLVMDAGGSCVQLAVTVTSSSGMMKVVVALLELVRVMFPAITVQPVKTCLSLVPAFMVTVTPAVYVPAPEGLGEDQLSFTVTV